MAVHRQYINCIKQLSNGNIMTCSSDGTIKIISLSNYHIIQSLKHGNVVIKEMIERIKNQIISFANNSYNEGLIYIWDKKENELYKCIHKFIPYDYNIYIKR